MTRAGSQLISIVIPFYNAAAHLPRCLDAIRDCEGGNYELILVDDGSTDDSARIAGRCANRLLRFPSPRGPAFARNRGAEAAVGDILFFIDSDVICFPDTLVRIRGAFASDPGLAAVIGSYDDAPTETNFLSRYKNLTHHYIHQSASRRASTFWTGCGAVRREIFLELNGFDESYRRPSIEDIEFGYRLRGKGYRIELHRELMAKHAKRWTLPGLLTSDLRDRALPWTLLQLRHGGLVNDLNVTRSQRASAILTCLAACLTFLGFWNPWCFAGGGAALLAVIGWNRSLYRFYYGHGGILFALGCVAMHWVYYLYSAAAFGAGFLLHLRRWRPAGSDGAAKPPAVSAANAESRHEQE